VAQDHINKKLLQRRCAGKKKLNSKKMVSKGRGGEKKVKTVSFRGNRYARRFFLPKGREKESKKSHLKREG